MERKKTPIKYCECCGEKLERKRMSNGKLEAMIHFNRRKYCNRECSSKAHRGQRKTTNPSWYTAHRWAREEVKKIKCEVCGKRGRLDVHHKDGNEKNNDPSNLQVLCRSCHMKVHRKKPICKVDGCDRPVKGYGYCDKHYQRFKKYGSPLITNRGHGHLVRVEV